MLPSTSLIKFTKGGIVILTLILRRVIVVDQPPIRQTLQGANLRVVYLVLEHVYLIFLRGKFLIHASQVLAHHAELSFVAAGRRLKFILHKTSKRISMMYGVR